MPVRKVLDEAFAAAALQEEWLPPLAQDFSFMSASLQERFDAMAGV